MAKREKIKLEERTYTIPLRREFQKVPIWRKTKKAVKATKEFLVKHMKSEEVRLGKELNEYLWQRGLKNPPHKVKVTVTKDEKGIVKAELFGMKKVKAKKEDVAPAPEPAKTENK